MQVGLVGVTSLGRHLGRAVTRSEAVGAPIETRHLAQVLDDALRGP